MGYDDMASYERIQQNVVDDPRSQSAQNFRQSLPQLIHGQEEVFMTSTVTEMNHE